MALSIVNLIVDGIAYESQDIAFGDAETKEITVQRDGKILRVNLKKRQVTFTARGVTQLQVTQFEQKAEDNIRKMIFGGLQTINIDIGGYVIADAVLFSITPSAPTLIEGVALYENCQFVYNSIGDWNVS